MIYCAVILPTRGADSFGSVCCSFVKADCNLSRRV